MKTVLLPVHPNWLELILSGKKTIEVRKTKPKEAVPFRVLLYCTKNPHELAKDKNGNIVLLSRNKKADISDLEILSGKVVAEFVCDFVAEHNANNQIQAYYNGTQETCLSPAETVLYAKGKRIYYWHISDLKIYDNPKELSEFRRKPCKFGRKGTICPFSCDKSGYSNDMRSIVCFNTIDRAPQSWCYVRCEK